MKKRILAIFLSLALLLSLVPLQSFAASVTSLQGSGTDTDPYKIGTAEELLFAAQQMNAGTASYVGKYYALTGDIDLSKAGTFPMINSFTGILNGMGHTIYGLTVNDTVGTVPSGGYGIGFIHKNYGTIRDLTFDGASITSVANAAGNGNSGAAVVAAENCSGAYIANVTVTNCKVDAPKVPKTAAIASMNSRSGNTTGTIIARIENCKVTDTVLIGGPRSEGNSYGLMMGAIAGYQGSSVIRNCYVANVTMQAASETGSPFHAGYICGYGAGGVMDGNVVASGKIERLAAEADQKFNKIRTGGICPSTNSYYGAIDQTKGNLIDTANAANTGSFTIMGTATEASVLQAQATYEALGWDMYAVWKMADGMPVLRAPDERNPLTLQGSGTAEDPYQIASTEDLLTVAKGLNELDARLVGQSFVLTADLDMSGINFTPINSFSGTLDGQGHTLHNFTIEDTTGGTQDANYRVAFIRINTGTVQNLVFRSPRITTQALSTGGYSGAAVIVGDNAHGSVISDCMVFDALVDAPNLPKAGGIAVMNARTNNINATIRRCVFIGDLICGPRAGAYGPQIGGIAAYSATSTIESCLVNANITIRANDTIQSTVAHAGGICGYINGVSFRKNVVYGGSITIEGAPATQNIGRIYGHNNFNNGSFAENLACEGFTLNGQVVSASNAQQGTPVSAHALLDTATYEDIGWDMDVVWAMTNAVAYPDRHPILVYDTFTDSPISRLTAVLRGDNGRSVGFSWYYAGQTAMTLLLDTDPSLANARRYTAVRTGERYKVSMTELAENTTYYYRVEGNGQTSNLGTFTTSAAAESFTFLSVSDTEAADLAGAKAAADSLTVARTMVPDASFILHSGDFVSESRGAAGWQEFLFCAADSLYSMPLVPTKGEADSAFFDYFNADNSYYSFDYGNAHIIVLDTTEDDTQGLSAQQISWLKADVAGTDQPWVILSMHKGPYTSGTHAAELTSLRELFIGELDELGIDLVIQGHDHIMGHTYDLKDGSLTGQPIFTETVNGKRFDYTIDATGTVYMMPGTAGTEFGAQMSADDLDDYILQFARSNGTGNVSTFSAVRVEKDRLTVENYEVHASMEATMVEGFGIDRELSQVEKLISDGAYAEARTAYHALSKDQKAQIQNYAQLLQTEGGMLSADGGAWLDEIATERRSILVHNDTDNAFTQVPVLVKIEKAPSRTMAFYTTQGEVLPYEIESYDAQGLSLVWVKLPYVPANSAAGLWVYFGGVTGCEDSHAVWSDSYALVEHFAGQIGSDSTGEQTGTVTGELQSVAVNGNKGAAFNGSSMITYESIGDDFNQTSVSAIVSLTAEDVTAMGGSAGIVSKYMQGNPIGKNAYLLGVNAEGKLHSYYGCMWWRNNQLRQKEYVTELLSDGLPHLITVTYDGFTIQTYVDGKLAAWETVFIESTTLFSKKILTTIGAYSPANGSEQISGGFRGNIYDVQISGFRTNDQWEAFRYATLLGDAVTVGQAESRGSLALTADAATRTMQAEAGMQSISILLSADATLTAQVNGRTIELGAVKAGQSEIAVPVIGSGAQTIVLTATRETQTAVAQLSLAVADTTAPKATDLTAQDDNTLTVQTEKANGDSLQTEFHISHSIPLTAGNTMVAQGSTADKTPANVDPALASYSALSAMTTTVNDGTNPYQIYRVTLTEEQLSYGAWRFFWQGESDRQIHAYGYDFLQKQWVKLASTEGTGELSLNIVAEGSQYAENGVLYLMLFRGMGQELSEMTSFIPAEGQYDFTMFWNSDTQYMSQFTEELNYHQHQWIVDAFAEKKGVITFNTGDMVNRSNLRYEYNWKVMEQAYNIFEEASIPYTFCWGNHDIDFDKHPNETRYYRTYFPASRLEENAGQWEVSFAPDATDGETTRAMALKQTLHGAKIMLLSLAYESRLEESDLAWAEEMVKTHPDYTVILLTHTYSSDTAILAGSIRSRIVDVYDNVKLVLNGHFDGASVFKMANGGFAVLQDYQGEGGGIQYGGNEFMRLIQFDVENNLVYFNTYSPLTGETISPYGAGLDPVAEGLYQKHGDEFAVSVELNGDLTRSFTTKTLLLTAAEPVLTQGITVTEGEPASVCPEGLTPDQEYGWYVTLTDSSGNSSTSATSLFTYRSTEPELDSNVKIFHSLNLASDIAINYAVKPADLAEYDSYYMECVLPVYEGNEFVGTETMILRPELRGGYYYFVLDGLISLEMNNMVDATLHMTKDGREYISNVDSFSVATYAYSQLNSASAPVTLKALSANLLRYGAKAQLWKGYRTDALADSAMSEAHMAYLQDLDSVEFGNNNRILTDISNPVITWAGKTMSLESKIVVRFVMNTTNYKGNLDDLSLRITFVNINGETETVTLTDYEVYSASRNYYAFDFDGLLSAEMRCVLNAAVYEGDTQLSPTMVYSIDTYGASTTGTLRTLVQAMVAYGDSAKAFFS